MRALIVGCGYVGTALSRLLLPDHEVHGIRRHRDGLPDGVVPWIRDVGTPFELPPSPAFDWVFYLVGADGHTPDAYRRAYEMGPAHTLAALTAAGQRPQRIVYASSTGVHGQSAGEVVDESAAAEPSTFSGRSVLAGEQQFAASAFAVTRVRFAGIYGPGRAGFVRGVLDGSIGLTEPDRFANRIHVDDCAGILHFVVTAPSAPPVVIAADPSGATRNDAIRWICARAGRVAAPEPTTAGSGATARRHGGDKRCHPAWLLAQGYRFRHPDFTAAYGAFVDDWIGPQPPRRAG